MPGHFLHRFFTSDSLPMRDLPTSNAAYLPSSCDEELADEADEPPDFHQYISPKDILHPISLSDGEFSKHSIRHTPPTTSLLTKALLTSPELDPVDRMPRQNPQRTMSTSSAWSIASTAELTSDGITSPSRANTPSPPPPMFLTGLQAIIPSPKTKFALPPPLKDVPTVEGLERKRCITFAAGKPAEKQALRPTFAPVEKPKPVVEQPRKSALTFVCSKPTDKLTVPMKPTFQRTRSPAPKLLRQREKVEGASDNINMPVKPVRWRHYDSPGPTDSWTDEPIDKSKLLRVDDLLKKERDIRKLSEEAEAEDAAEMDEDNNDENEDNDDDEDEDEEEDDTILDDRDESDEYLSDSDDSVYGGQSGNETDIEEGFASDDESDDELFFGPKLPPAFSDHIRPLGMRNISEDSDDNERIHLRKGASSPRRIRIPTPELPEIEDFVCGTFDEDQPLEDAYISALEEKKRMKHKPTPQDIDPSFPTSDSEPEDEPQPRRRGSDAGRASSIEKKSTGRVRAPSPAPMRRSSIAHSPAPVRRRMVSPPPPVSRQGSRQTSRQASRQSSRQASRQGSPAPSTRGRLQFNTGFPTTRTLSLPRPGACFRRTGKNKLHAESRPMVIKRSAMDIYEGLEKRRERRRARFTRKPHADGWRAGEGVEKMREVALDLCGRGKPQALWVLSA